MTTDPLRAQATTGDGGQRRDALARWGWTAVALVVAALGIAVKIDDGSYTALETTLDATCGLALIGTGTWALGQPRDRRLGYVFLLAGGARFAENLVIIDGTFLRLVGELLSSASMAPLAYLALTFPGSVLRDRASRLAMALVVVGALVLSPLKRATISGKELSAEYVDRCGQLCDWRLIVPDVFWQSVVRATAVVGVVGGVLVLVLLVRRYIRASRPLRASIGPFMWCALAIVVLIIADQLLRLVVSEGSRDGIVGAENVLTALLALAFPLGLLRVRMRRAAAAGMVVELAALAPGASAREVLVRALGDPDIELVLFGDGPAEVQAPPHRVATPLVAGERTLGVLVHDPALEEAVELVAAAATALGLRLDNERLTAAQAALAEVAGAERRRLERDLHDGAQQRIVALRMVLAALRDDVADGDPQLAARLGEVEDGLRDAVQELRDLARGMHPRALEEGGLGPAVRALAARTPMAITVHDEIGGRLAPDVESTGYYVVCEALANAGKHAAARSVEVRLARGQDELVCEVRDDGRGGARIQDGGGLAGLAVRVGVLGGVLDVESAAGAGTCVRARIPAGA